MDSRRLFMVSSAVAMALVATPFTLRTAVAADAFKFKMFDAHTHLISDDQQKYPRAQQASGPPPGDSMAAAMGAAAPAAPATTQGASASFAKTPVASPEAAPEVNRLLGWMDKLGVESIAAVQRRGTYGYDNSYILDSSDLHKDRFAPVAVLDAQDVRTPDYVRSLVKTRGLAGIRLTGAPADDGSFPWLESPQALKVWAVANEYGLVIDLMNSPPGKSPAIIAEYIKLAQRYPNVRLVLDHVAWPDAQGAPDYGIDAIHQSLGKQKNIYYKYTTLNVESLQPANIPLADFLRRVVDVYGADHVLWGSDVGNAPGTYEQFVGWAVESSAKLTEAEKRQVFHDTGKAVFVRGGKLGK